jgi:hypothetical protein
LGGVKQSGLGRGGSAEGITNQSIRFNNVARRATH